MQRTARQARVSRVSSIIILAEWVAGIREGQLMTPRDENGDLIKIGARLKWRHHEAGSAGASAEFDYFRSMARSQNNEIEQNPS